MGPGEANGRGGSAALAYWLDVECLTPPEIALGRRDGRSAAVRRDDRAIAWPGGLQAGSAAGRAGHGFSVRVGLFDVRAAYDRIAELLGAAPEERHDGGGSATGFLAAFRADAEGRVVADSFRASLFALRFASLPHGSPTPDELSRRRGHLVGLFAGEWSGAGGPLDVDGLARIDAWLRGSLRQRPTLFEEAHRPFAQVGRIEEDEEDDGASLESFQHGDLSRVASAWRRGAVGAALARYLDPGDLAEATRRDADDPAVVEAVLDPATIPPAKWPSRGAGGPAAALRQQMAVNAACSTTEGLCAVNGPPGTGKSTLLRDVIADAVARRAEVLCRFDRPRDAFVRRDLDGRPAWAVDPSLRGHGILVCSGNNKAVENVTRELPSIEALAPSLRQDPEFRRRAGALAGVAAAVGDGAPAWGLVSAALGNRGNRRRFAEAFWPAYGTGRRIVLDAPRLLALGRHGRAGNGNAWIDCTLADASGSHEVRAWGELAERIMALPAEALGQALARQAVLARKDWVAGGARGGRRRGLDLRELSDEAPATGIAQALADAGADTWEDARERFLAALAESRRLIGALDTVAHGPDRLRRLDVRLGHALATAGQSASALAEAEAAAQAAEARLSGKRRLFAEAGAALVAAKRRRPGLLARIAGRAGTWEAELRAAKAAVAAAQDALRESSGEAVAAQNLGTRLGREASAAREAVAGLRAERDALAVAYRDARDAFLDPPLAPSELLARPPAARETGTPWLTAEVDRAREAVFAAAMALHAAFLRAASGPVLDNLRLHLDLIAGDREAGRAAEPRGEDLWNTFFLAVPVVSSTFASLGPMLGDAIPAAGLGWVLVDEAGQAKPQDAAGAVWRGRRVLVVGDPKQVEPVVRIPAAVSGFLARHHGVANPAFDPRRGSVQTMADRTAALGAWLGGEGDRTWVGCPLRVHRRCDEPMFSISNAASYGGSMVLGKPAPDYASWRGDFPEWGPGGRASEWIDIREGGGEGKWTPAAAGMALLILQRMVAQRDLADGLRLPDGRPARAHLTPEGLPDAFVITPFADVAVRFRKEVIARRADFAKHLPDLGAEALKGWAEARVGTVHAFQGGEAPTVILLLGGHAATKGAIRWATGRANVLNVAVTRARSALYVVGNRELWLRGAFSAAGGLRVTGTPAYLFMAPDRRGIERLGSLDAHLGALGRALSEARERVVICSPFLRDRAVEHPALPVLDLVRSAVSRGVDVRVYADGRFNTGAADLASARAAGEALRRAGATVRLVDGLHAKTLCVDDSWIVDGSFNWLSAPRDGALQRHEASYLYGGSQARGHVAEAVASVEALREWVSG